MRQRMTMRVIQPPPIDSSAVQNHTMLPISGANSISNITNDMNIFFSFLYIDNSNLREISDGAAVGTCEKSNGFIMRNLMRS